MIAVNNRTSVSGENHNFKLSVLAIKFSVLVTFLGRTWTISCNMRLDGMMAIGCVSPEEAKLYPAMKSNQRRSNCTIMANLRMQTLLKPVTIILFKGVSLSKYCCFYRIPESKFWSGWTSGVARPGEIWLVEVIQTPSPSPQRCFILWDQSTWRILTCNLSWYKPAKTGMAAYKKCLRKISQRRKHSGPQKKSLKWNLSMKSFISTWRNPRSSAINKNEILKQSVAWLYLQINIQNFSYI